jgi:hypothetical protein
MGEVYKARDTRLDREVAINPVTLQAQDFSREKPVSDALFRVYKSLYSYDKTPLHAAVESAEETEDWKREKITFAAAYGNERVIAYLFLPKKSQPPFQTVVRSRAPKPLISDPVQSCLKWTCLIS